MRQLTDDAVGKLGKLRMLAGLGELVRIADCVTKSESSGKSAQAPDYRLLLELVSVIKNIGHGFFHAFVLLFRLVLYCLDCGSQRITCLPNLTLKFFLTRLSAVSFRWHNISSCFCLTGHLKFLLQKLLIPPEFSNALRSDAPLCQAIFCYDDGYRAHDEIE